MGTLFQEPTNPLKASCRPTVGKRILSAPWTGKNVSDPFKRKLGRITMYSPPQHTHTHQTPEKIPPDLRILRSRRKLYEQYSALPPSTAKALQASLPPLAERTRSSVLLGSLAPLPSADSSGCSA